MDFSSLLLILSAPIFAVGMLVELCLLRVRRMASYDRRDALLNIATGLVNQVLAVSSAVIELALLVMLANVMPWHLHGWAAWVVGMVAVDFAYYWYHRCHHQIRALWAIHVVHHSSEQFNLSVALRQPWAVFTSLPFVLPLALIGIDARVIITCYAANLLFQFFIHTELVDKLWAPVEFVFNTPSHHRVHHGSQNEYLDKNYGGILIVWDRLFGTFAAENARVRYGLTKNINTHNIFRVYGHEFVSIWRNVTAASNWRERVNYLLRGPGWSPAATTADRRPEAVAHS